MPTDAFTISLVGICLTAILGAVGWLIIRDITQGDQRRERIAIFLRDMRRREQEIIKGLSIYHYAGESFSNWKPRFIVEARTLEGDFSWRRRKFRRLVSAISNMQPGDVDTNSKDDSGELTGPKKLLTAIQELIGFLE